MASIIYKPHCDKCGHLIDTDKYEIEYQDVYTPVHGILGVRQFASIAPAICPHCGAYFESIEIPMPKKGQDIYEFH